MRIPMKIITSPNYSSIDFKHQYPNLNVTKPRRKTNDVCVNYLWHQRRLPRLLNRQVLACLGSPVVRVVLSIRKIFLVHVFRFTTVRNKNNLISTCHSKLSFFPFGSLPSDFTDRTFFSRHLGRW